MISTSTPVMHIECQVDSIAFELSYYHIIITGLSYIGDDTPISVLTSAFPAGICRSRIPQWTMQPGCGGVDDVAQEEKCRTGVEAGNVHVPVFMRLNVAVHARL